MQSIKNLNGGIPGRVRGLMYDHQEVTAYHNGLTDGKPASPFIRP